MNNKTTTDIAYSFEDSSDDEEETAIITNIDEFCTINELQNSSKNVTNKLPPFPQHRVQPKKIPEPYKISSPIQNITNPHMNLYSLLLNGENNPVKKSKKIIKKKLKMKKKSTKKGNNYGNLSHNVKKFLDISKKNGKSVFLKISEDIYTKLKSKPNKEIRDINKTEEDAYNKMTSDPYLQTCENKENIKNKKIVQQCLDRKAKEDIFKKIGIECDRNKEKKKLYDPKRAFSVTDKNLNLKSTRTLSQFLRDQIGERKKERKYNKNTKKIPLPVTGNILPQDSTFIFSENKGNDYSSQFSDFSGNFLDYENDCKSMITKSDMLKIKIEEEKDVSNKNDNNKINKTFLLGKDNINSNNFSLISDNNNKDTKFKNNKINKNNNNRNTKKNLKDTSTSSITKNSLEMISKKFLNLYKEIIETIFGKTIDNNFDISFSYFLLIIYKLGFTNKNYSSLLEMSYENDTKKMGTMHPSVISDISISNASSSLHQINQVNHTNKRNNNNFNIKNKSLGGKSLEDEVENYTVNSFKNDKEFILCKDAWKILTEKKNFDEEICINSKTFFLFFISVMGIGDYIRGKSNHKKDCDFFFNDKKILTQYNNMKKYINKYFGIFAVNANDNSFNSEKRNMLFKSNMNSYSNSVGTSFAVNNSDINNKYNIYEKNYCNNKNININNFEETNSVQLFNEGIKEEEKFFYTINDKSEKSLKTLTLTDLNNLENNNNNFLNSSLTESSSILELKKFLNPNTSEKMEDEIDLESFLFEDEKNNFNYNNKIKEKNGIKTEEIKSKTKKNIKTNNNNNINNNQKKRVGYVFEIKVENEIKKLILKKTDDKNLVVKNFCEKYGINEEEKNKILKIIDERLKNYSAN